MDPERTIVSMFFAAAAWAVGSVAQCRSTNVGQEVNQQRQPPATLILTISRISPVRGDIRLAIFQNTDEYAERRAARSLVVRVDERVASVSIGELRPGCYAILVHHDADGDGRLDRGLFGIPSEPVAASNNARGRFGPPKWHDAAILLSPGVNLHEIEFGDR